MPIRVNRWGIVTSEIKVEPASASKLVAVATPSKASAAAPLGGAAQPAGDSGNGACAGTLSTVPEYTPAPRLAAIEVKDGVARLAVTDTVPYLTYGIASGATPSKMTAEKESGIADGAVGAIIEFEADATQDARFFKVTRAE